MRLITLSSLMVVLGLVLSACGGESVEDRARTLKSQRQQPAAPSMDPNAPPPAQPMMMPPPAASGSSSAAPAPMPPG